MCSHRRLPPLSRLQQGRSQWAHDFAEATASRAKLTLHIPSTPQVGQVRKIIAYHLPSTDRIPLWCPMH
jgi:hypothetical protein